MEQRDIPLVKQIDSMVFDDNAWDAESFADQLDRDDCLFFVLYDDENPGLVLGYGGVNDLGSKSALISLVAVHPDLQRRKIGGYIVKLLSQWAFKRGVRRLFLQTKVDNYSAHKTYSSAGFKVIGTIPGYYRNTGEDALLWRLSVPDVHRFPEIHRD